MFGRQSSPYSARHGSLMVNTPEYGQNYQMNQKFYEKDKGGLASIDGQKIYFMGVIDILTGYNAKKKAEHFIKSI